MTIVELKNIFENYTGFISLVYTNKSGEKSKHLVNLGFNYGNAVEKDIKKFENNEIQFIESDKYTLADWNLAYSEKNNSLINPSENRSKGQTEGKVRITANGSLTYNINTGNIYIEALSVKKDVLEAGIYKETKSNAKTIAKRSIEKQLHTNNIKRFVFDKIANIKINGNEIEIITE